MKTTLALLFALAGCLDQVDLDQSEQALDGSARVRMFSLSSLIPFSPKLQHDLVAIDQQ